ncbi:MAG: aromatic amino acid lyase, partial [Chloroflexi bacterium]|nr:aromatic amino acid lyase [Chloroflexota bacterium]
QTPESTFQALSGGNFHGEVMAMAMDFLGIALAEVGALAERQINRLVSDKYSYGLPPMLVNGPQAAGLNSGLMMPHYTAASLALENQTLAHPDSVHSLPTSAGQEDHNANALTAARHARQIVRNVEHILGVEFFVAAQAVDLRAQLLPDRRLAPATAAAHARIRREAPFIAVDRLFGPEIERVAELVRNGELVMAVEAAGVQLKHTHLKLPAQAGASLRARPACVTICPEGTNDTRRSAPED